MTETGPTASIPAAWLRPIPEGFRIPIWRWIFLPAVTLMMKRSGGVWISGMLELTPTELRFTQSKPIIKSRSPAQSWTISLERISGATISKGLGSETLIIHHAGGTARIMMVRADSFIDQLRTVIRFET